MNSLERAKRFLANRASRLALTVVPLAALAIAAPHARANEVLSPSGGCSAVGGNGVCLLSQQSPSGGDPGMNWIAMNASGTGFSPNPAVQNVLQFEVNVGSASGSLAPGTIPVSWDFTIAPGTPGTNVGWDVDFYLYVNGSFLDGGSIDEFTANGSGSGTIQGTGSISYSGGDITGYQILFETYSPAPFTVLGSSVDMNPVPEPSGLLVISAAGALIFLRRRKHT